MTPLQIQMMLWYHCRCNPYAENEPEHARSEAVREQRQALIDLGLLIVGGISGYEVTEKGKAYIKFLQDVQVPVFKWVQPE